MLRAITSEYKKFFLPSNLISFRLSLILPRFGLHAVKTSLNYSWSFHIDMVWEMFFADIFILPCLQELLTTSCLDRRVPSLSRASVSSPVNEGGSSSQNIFGSVMAGALARNSPRSWQPAANHGDGKKKKKDVIWRLNAKGIMQLAKDVDHRTWESNCSTCKCLLN